MKVLFVDDDINILESFQRSLRKKFEIDVALGGEAALQKMGENGPYAVIVSDMSMPGMNGIQFLARAAEVAPQTVRMMLTGNADLSTAVEALNRGNIFRFLLKPCLPDALEANLQVGVEQYKLVTAERELLEKTLQGTIRMLIEILALVNPTLFGRAQNLRVQMRTVAEAMALPDIWKLELIALLSPVGVVTLPSNILEKLQTRRKLTEDEEAAMRRVPEISAKLVAKIPRLESVALGIRYSAKQFDGLGTPSDKVHGKDIPIGARLLKILDDLAYVQSGNVTESGAFSILNRRQGVYDPELLAMAHVCLAPDPNALKNLPEGRPIASGAMTAGMLLTTNIETTSGLLLVPAGRILTETLLEHVRNFASLSGLKEPICVRAEDVVTTSSFH